MVKGNRPTRRDRRARDVADVRCPVGKVPFRTWNRAASSMHRLDATRIYLGSCCGFWHVTNATEADYSQQMATDPVDNATSQAAIERWSNDHDSRVLLRDAGVIAWLKLRRDRPAERAWVDLYRPEGPEEGSDLLFTSWHSGGPTIAMVTSDVARKIDLRDVIAILYHPDTDVTEHIVYHEGAPID